MATPIAALDTLTSIIAGVVAAVAVDHTSNSGKHDLSTAGTVTYGRQHRPPTAIPHVSIDVLGVSKAEDGPPLGWYESTAEIAIEGWAPVVTDTPVASIVAGLDLANDVTTAVENAHRDTGGSLRSSVRNLSFGDIEFLDNDGTGTRRIGHFRTVLTVVYAQARGI